MVRIGTVYYCDICTAETPHMEFGVLELSDTAVDPVSPVWRADQVCGDCRENIFGLVISWERQKGGTGVGGR